MNFITTLVLLSLLACSYQEETYRRPTTDQIDVAREVVAPHVVPMQVLAQNNSIYGTGFHLKFLDKTYIITNAHVCTISKELGIYPYIQFGNSIEKIIRIDNEHDLCLVSSSRASGLTLAGQGLDPMEKLFLVGYPRGLQKTIREGRLISTQKEIIPWVSLDTPIYTQQISATAYGGNSGSPVTNTDGEVVGVLFAGIQAYPHEPFVGPLMALKRFLLRHVMIEGR